MRFDTPVVRLLVLMMLVGLGVAPAGAATGTEARLKPSKAMPVVGEEVQLAVEITHQGSEPRALTGLTLEHVRPDGSVEPLALQGEAGQLEAGQTATLRGTLTPTETGFHRFRLRAGGGGGDAPVLEAGTLPVHTEPVALMYWHAPRFMENLTWRLVVGAEDVDYWHERGVVAARWMPGVAKRPQNWTRDQFVERWSEPLPPGYTAIAIDEFGGVAGTPVDLEMSAALVELKKKQTGRQVAVWSIKFHPDAEQTRAYKEAADLLMVEVYSSHFASNGRFARDWNAVKAAGLADKTIFALWLDRVLTTEQDIHRQLRHLRRVSPEARGLCINGNATEDLFRAIDRLVHEYFVKPVLLVEEGPAGRWQARNIGWMAARDVQLPAAGGSAQGRTLPTVEPGQVIDLGIRSSEALTLVRGEGFTWLHEAEDEQATQPPATDSPTPGRGDATAGGVDLLAGAAPVAQGKNLVRLPIDAVEADKPFTLTFDIAFDRVQPYGIIAVGLGNDKLTDYTDTFLKYFDKTSSSPSRLEMRFFRGDIEMRSSYKMKGARGIFGYENAEGRFVRASPDMGFEAGEKYRVSIHRQPASVEIVAQRLGGGDGQVWRSGPLRIDSQAPFNEAYVRVRSGSASSIAVHPERGEVVARSGTKAAEDDRVMAEAAISNLRLIPQAGR